MKIRVTTALWLGAAYAMVVFSLIVAPMVWGDTTTRCKPSGFTSGAVFRATDADCLDTSPRNTINSQLSDTNIRPGAAIQGNKIDGVFASLVSTMPVYFSAPGINVSRLRSETGIVFDAASLASTGPITFASPSIVISALGSINAVTAATPTLILSSLASVGGLISMGGAGIATPTIRLQSAYFGTAPPPSGTMFANLIPTAFMVDVDLSVGAGNGVPTSLFSMNLSLRTNSNLVSGYFATPMSTTNYLVLSTGGNDPNCVMQNRGNRGTTSFGMFVVKPSDNTQCIATVQWNIIVFGGQ